MLRGAVPLAGGINTGGGGGGRRLNRVWLCGGVERAPGRRRQLHSSSARLATSPTPPRCAPLPASVCHCPPSAERVLSEYAAATDALRGLRAQLAAAEAEEGNQRALAARLGEQEAAAVGRPRGRGGAGGRGR